MEHGGGNLYDNSNYFGGSNNNNGMRNRGKNSHRHYPSSESFAGGSGYYGQFEDFSNRDVRQSNQKPTNQAEKSRSKGQDGNNNNNKNEDEWGSNQSNCLMQCFFNEMKMTTNEGFPDRHKVLRVMSEDIRDRDLKDFYTDSITECFAHLELDSKRKEKCEFSKKFVTCLTERAKANCDDWNEGASILLQK